MLQVDARGARRALRRRGLHGTLDRLIESIEQGLGASLGDLPRAEKQAAVRILESLGAFLLRGAVDVVAERIGVNRITVYNYVNAISLDQHREVGLPASEPRAGDR